MAMVVVVVQTDHSELDDAVRSVANSMKRAGYDLDGFTVAPQAHLNLFEIRAVINVSEPELRDRG
jgi:hypothetical protein